jgi:hypothetical protein
VKSLSLCFPNEERFLATLGMTVDARFQQVAKSFIPSPRRLRGEGSQPPCLVAALTGHSRRSSALSASLLYHLLNSSSFECRGLQPKTESCSLPTPGPPDAIPIPTRSVIAPSPDIALRAINKNPPAILIRANLQVTFCFVEQGIRKATRNSCDLRLPPTLRGLQA